MDSLGIGGTFGTVVSSAAAYFGGLTRNSIAREDYFFSDFALKKNKINGSNISHFHFHYCLAIVCTSCLQQQYLAAGLTGICTCMWELITATVVPEYMILYLTLPQGTTLRGIVSGERLPWWHTIPPRLHLVDGAALVSVFLPLTPRWWFNGGRWVSDDHLRSPLAFPIPSDTYFSIPVRYTLHSPLVYSCRIGKPAPRRSRLGSRDRAERQRD